MEIEIKKETMEMLRNVQRVNESYDELIKRLVMGEDMKNGLAFMVIIKQDNYEKIRNESYMTKVPIGRLLSMIVNSELDK